MKVVSVLEAKTHFANLLKDVEQGEEILITKHGQLVAKLVPSGSINRELIHTTIEKLQQFSLRHTLGSLNWKELRDEGRK